MTNNEALDPEIPGSDIVAKGLEDIRNQRITAYALLLQVAAPRLKRLGIDIPILQGIKNPEDVPYEHQLYELLESTGGHGLYNALSRRIASFASTIEARKPRTETSLNRSESRHR
jgi:hypothetical protein